MPEFSVNPVSGKYNDPEDMRRNFDVAVQKILSLETSVLALQGAGAGAAAGTVLASQENVDFTALGETTLFTPEGTDEYAITHIIFEPTDVDSPNGDNSYNVGCEGPNYDELINTQILGSLAEVGDYVSITAGGFGTEALKCSAANPLKIKITGADTGTAFTHTVHVAGYKIS